MIDLIWEYQSLSELDFPGQVFISPNGKMLVADSNNNRILIWKTFPTKSAQPADYAINIDQLIGTKESWPWGVWTDDEKLAVSVTSGGDNGNKIILWNSFPNSGSVQPNLSIKHSSIGTPRGIVSNGEFLLVGDENGKTECSNGSSSHIWANWPTKSNQAPDACLGSWVGGTIIGKISSIINYKNLKNFKNKLDPRLYNGAILLGLEKPVIKSHGSTDFIGFANSLKVCEQTIRGNLIEQIKLNIN